LIIDKSAAENHKMSQYRQRSARTVVQMRRKRK